MPIEHSSNESTIAEHQPSVLILYDSGDTDLTACAVTIRTVVFDSGIPTRILGVQSYSFLEYALCCEAAEIIIYVFQSNSYGIIIRDQEVSWSDLTSTVSIYSDVEHIVPLGNSNEMKKINPNSPNLHTETANVVDLRLAQIFSLWITAEILVDYPSKTVQEKGRELRNVVMHDFCDNISELMSKSAFPDVSTGEDIPDPITDPRLTETWSEVIPQYDEEGTELKPILRLSSESAQDEESEYISLRDMTPTSGIGGAIGWVLDHLLSAITGQGMEDLQLNMDAAKNIVAKMDSIVEDVRLDIIDWFKDKGYNVTMANISTAIPQLLQSDMFELWSLSDQLILDAWYEADDWITEFIERIVATPVQTDLKGLIPVFLFRLGTPLNLGSSFASFGAVLRIKVLPTFEIDKTFFKSFMNDVIFGNDTLAALNDTEAAFTEVHKFIDVIPIMDIDLGVCAFLPKQSTWTKALLDGFTLDFFGSAHFQIAFQPIDASGTDRSFMEVREWGLRFELDASYGMTIATFLAPGASGAINTILEYIEPLLQATLTLTLSVIFEISKKYQGQGLPDLSTLLLDIVVGVTLDIRLLIAVFKGTFKVGMSFEQKEGVLDSGSTALAEGPMSPFVPSDTSTSTIGVYLTLYCSLYLGIDLWLVSFGTHFGGPWEDTFTIYSDSSSSEYGSESADLTDTDKDGLPDAFETRMNQLYGSTYLDPNLADTDGDGLNDKLELEINTFPNDADSDDDQLSDYAEHITHGTDPLLNDTEFDGLDDYEEVEVYGTSPFIIDTDADGLSDFFEVNETYDVTYTKNTYGAINEILVGGVVYDDKTDPLNPDTDNDMLLDGEEWKNGVEYANQSVVNANDYIYLRWTHPLDADSDDDSVLWFDGGGYFYPSNSFLYDMNDGIEVLGQYITFIDIEGYPVVEYVKCNPVNPDTDFDTVVALFYTDGYELSRDPPTNPTNGDTDHDGLLDGGEVIGPGAYGTDALNPDTDNDNLPDYEDYILPTDQRDPDTDDDQILDGDEYYIYGTNPCLADSDFDGLTDSEELFFFYCNPMVRDSDADGLTDGEEILIYLTDPLLNDTDGDMLEDGYEVDVSGTDPRLFDTDNDQLGDGAELFIYKTNPLDWDSDHDSLTYPNENGSITLALSDGDEVLVYGTNPNSVDTDLDGLTDSQEIYLAMGAPSFDPIPLDPLNNDTDGDSLLDGYEMIIKNVTLMTYPYEGIMKELRFGSCPVKNDTDGDGLLDNLELELMCDPSDHDTDDDTLSDWMEVNQTGTSPLSNDTDGDEIPDNLEAYNITLNTTTSSMFMLSAAGELTEISANQWVFPTSATDSDSDDDLLPDGLEIIYGTNPFNPDDNNNGILDGYEFDLDGDGLSDAEEIYIYQTHLAPLPISDDWTWIGDPGGIANPDSDGDSIPDGIEVHTYGSDPTSTDSDGDGISDSDEIALGGDPLVPITSGLPTWVIIAAAGGVGLVVGLVLPPLISFTKGKISDVRGSGSKKSKKRTKKTKRKTKSKKEGDTK